MILGCLPGRRGRAAQSTGPTRGARPASMNVDPNRPDHAPAFPPPSTRSGPCPAGLVQQRGRTGPAGGAGSGDGAGAGLAPAGGPLGVVRGRPGPPRRRSADGRGLALRRNGAGFDGGVRCRLPLPFASEAFGAILLQHALDDGFADRPRPGRVRADADARRHAVAGRAESVESVPRALGAHRSACARSRRLAVVVATDRLRRSSRSACSGWDRTGASRMAKSASARPTGCAPACPDRQQARACADAADATAQSALEPGVVPRGAQSPTSCDAHAR